jgi:hypothetical protein
MIGLHNTDSVTLAYINLYAVLGTLENLCQIDEEAGALIADADIRVGFAVNGGPKATLVFDHGKCRLEEGAENCDIRLPFKSPEKFNGLIAGTVTPVPSKGFTKIPFLLKKFTKLTDILTKYLKASEEDLKDPAFFEKSTILMFYTIVSAVSQIGNHDKISCASAGYMVDGIVRLSVAGGPAAGICVKDHRLKTVKKMPKAPMAYMEFQDIQTARALFDGKVNAVACIGTGKIRMGGMISMIDNLNRILDRVGLYLAD